MEISANQAFYTQLAGAATRPSQVRDDAQLRTNPINTVQTSPNETTQRQETRSSLPPLEPVNEGERQNRTTFINENREDPRSQNPRANRARPEVIEQTLDPATRTFLEVANPPDDFRLIDIYV